MKRILGASVAALALVLATQQQASAWHKCNFGIGLNLSCEGGGNCVLWGMFKGAQTPGHVDGYIPDHHPVAGFDPSMFGPPAFEAPHGHPAVEPIGPPLAIKPAAYQYQPVGYQAYPYQAMGYYYNPYYYNWYPMYYPR
jgi:hypothetical protein